MPFGAPTVKQTITQSIVSASGGTFAFASHHHRPFRRHHVIFLVMSVLFVGIMLLETTAILSRQSLDPRRVFNPATSAVPVDTTTPITSSLGFELRYDDSLFAAGVRSKSGATLSPYSPNTSATDLATVVLKTVPSNVPAEQAASELEMSVETDDAAFASYVAQPRPRTDISALTADYFSPKSTSLATISEQSRTTEAIGGSLFTKTIYRVAPLFAGNPTDTIIWTTQLKTKPFAISLRGLKPTTGVPLLLQPIFGSMSFQTDTKVNGLSIFAKNDQPPTIAQKYMADLVSPSVVKVYHIVCGSLVYDNRVLSSDSCSGATGSGFFVSNDGYVATNGHVVVYGAKDMLVKALLSNSTLLEQFLSTTRLSKMQVREVLSRADLTASVVASIYDISDARLRLDNQRQLTVVATGSRPFDITDQAAVSRAMQQFTPTENLKQAQVVGYDYAAKDQLTVVADPEQGFSASDVALLKIDQSQTPLIPISNSLVTQNQPMTLFGFPGDADNQLTDNSQLSVSVTNGAISAIREAAGSDARLYQSDADASHGNSGGPAINENGEAFGLLTYRYTSGADEDAAKSYIRDIKDFTNLVSDSKVSLTTTSLTQDAWRRGLDLYSKRYYSKALKEFETVQRLYPSHRLVASYIEYSQQAITDGKDIAEPPALLLALGFGAGLGGLGVAVLMIASHARHHMRYRRVHQPVVPA